MNPNKIVSYLIVIAVYCGPVGMLFIYNDVLVDSFREMGLFLAAIFGLIIAFYFNVNQPLGRSKASKAKNANDTTLRKAA